MKVHKPGFAWSVLFGTLLFSGSICAFGQSCPDVPSEHEAVAQTLRTMYAGVAKDDFEATRKVLAPDFYAFDGGKSFPGTSLVDYVKTLHHSGYSFVWTVPNPTVRTACNTAWITYTNVGSVTDPSGTTTPMQWLESAVLQKENGQWQIHFFHSTRVPAPEPTPAPSPAK